MVLERYQTGKQVIEGWNDVFKTLSAEPRRQLIVSLLDAPPDQSVPLPESAINPNVPPDPDVLRQELVHQHLPMLAGYDFVEWEMEPLRAFRGRKFQEVAVVMDTLQKSASDIPDSLVLGCQRLETKRQLEVDTNGDGTAE